MRIQSLLVTALVEIDVVDEKGTMLGTQQIEYRVSSLDDAYRLLFKFKQQLKKGETHGVQPQESPKPEDEIGTTVDQ